MHILFILLIYVAVKYFLFIRLTCHKFTQPSFSGVPTTAVSTSVPSEIVPDWSKEPWCTRVGYVHLSVEKKRIG